jgi:hypothetical protein
MRKTPLQQLLIHPPNLLELGKSHSVPRKVTRFRVARIFPACACLSANLRVEGRGKNKE